MFTLGYIIPILAEMMGGGDGDDDDKNAYYNLPEYVRRSNICFRAGNQWISIPLPIEYRAMYGLGELAYGVTSGNERYSNKELAREIAAQVSQILPIDMLEGGGGWHAFIPSLFKPVTEAYLMNEGWTGLPIYRDNAFNKNDPEWTKAYASADNHLVDFTRWLNETTGGNDYKKGDIDINPAKLEYLLSGTFGGLFTFPNKGEKMRGDDVSAIGSLSGATCRLQTALSSRATSAPHTVSFRMNTTNISRNTRKRSVCIASMRKRTRAECLAMLKG